MNNSNIVASVSAVPPHIVARLLSSVAILTLALARQHALNIFQLLALVTIGSNSGVSIKEIRKRLAIPGSSLTFTIDSLEKKRLIRRQRSKVDRRQWLLSLSTSGEQLYAKILSDERAALSSTLENLSETEKEAFLNLTGNILRVENGIKASQEELQAAAVSINQ